MFFAYISLKGLSAVLTGFMAILNWLYSSSSLFCCFPFLSTLFCNFYAKRCHTQSKRLIAERLRSVAIKPASRVVAVVAGDNRRSIHRQRFPSRKRRYVSRSACHRRQSRRRQAPTEKHSRRDVDEVTLRYKSIVSPPAMCLLEPNACADERSLYAGIFHFNSRQLYLWAQSLYCSGYKGNGPGDILLWGKQRNKNLLLAFRRAGRVERPGFTGISDVGNRRLEALCPARKTTEERRKTNGGNL